MKKIVFRVDSGNHIGIGHMMRCLTLAKELLVSDVEIHFITRNHKGASINLISEDFITHLLNDGVSDILSIEDKDNYSLWLGVTEEEDLRQCNLILDSIGPVDIIVLDHYSLDKTFEESVNAKNVFVIDDLFSRIHQCDILLNQNLGTEETDYSKSKVGSFLLGPQFSLLRPEFKKLHQELVASEFFNLPIKSILVFFGNGDIGGNCLKFAKSLRSQDLEKFIFTFILNQNHKDYEELIKWGKPHQNVKILSFVSEMSKVILEHDFFIGAGGATSWERACLGVPSAILNVAENQVKICEALDYYNWAYYLGKNDQLENHVWHDLLDNKINTPLTMKMALNAFNGVDGEGTIRVCQKILGLINEN